jgi:hypothetical protein
MTVKIVIYNNVILASGDFNASDYGLECQFVDIEVPPDFTASGYIWDGFNLVRP